VLAAAASLQRDRQSGQESLFDDLAPVTDASTKTEMLDLPNWTQEQLLAFEKELLGFYVTGHPLDPYKEILMSDEFTRISDLGGSAEGIDPETGLAGTIESGDFGRRSALKLGGALASCEKKFTRRDGKPFVVAILEDLTGTIEVTFWNEAYNKAAALLEVGQLVWVIGRLDARSETRRFIAMDAGPLKASDPAHGRTAAPKKSGSLPPLRLRFDARRDSVAALAKVEEILVKHPGPRPVEMDFECDGRTVARLRAAQRFSVKLTPELAEILSPWLEGG
jgi:DNA polymerase-3 subunit alpha